MADPELRAERGAEGAESLLAWELSPSDYKDDRVY